MNKKSNYDHQSIESKWQKKWAEEGIYFVDTGSKQKQKNQHLKAKSYKLTTHNSNLNYYCLDMLPYPSGAGMHVGHLKGYVGSDTIARYKRMKGYNVIHPMGWDSFGLPAENYALKVGQHPKELNKELIKKFKSQLNPVGFSYDWTKEVNTADPEYIKWTQWFFLLLYKRGLAYRKEAPVNWCPSCQTVLANEQVVKKEVVISTLRGDLSLRSFANGDSREEEKSLESDSDSEISPPVGRASQGRNDAAPTTISVCERCGTEVIQKQMKQWFFKITDYADRLLSDLDQLDWPESTKLGQRNWIGRSEGAEIKFQITNFKLQTNTKQKNNEAIEQFNNEIIVFTTRPDTLYGVTFMAIAPELAQKWIAAGWQASDQVKKYITASINKGNLQRQSEEKEKTGVDAGITAIHPLTKKEIPVFVADYVIMDYGTGALMGVPAHDERDFKFAKKYKLEIKPVVLPQRTYVDENAKAYYEKRTKLHKEILSSLIKKANAENKKLIVQGGWAATIQAGKEYREHEDLDLLVMKEDLDWLKNELSHMGLKLGNLFPEGKNKEYYFQATKQDIHIDVSAIDINKEGKVVFLEPENSEVSNYLFEKFVQEEKFQKLNVLVVSKKILYEMKQKTAREKGDDLRWKEVSDYLVLGFEPYSGEGEIVNCQDWNGLKVPQDIDKILNDIENRGIGKKQTTYKLRDWLISRQRYWGAPIPMIYCQACAHRGRSWLLEQDLSFRPSDDEGGEEEKSRGVISTLRGDSREEEKSHTTEESGGDFSSPMPIGGRNDDPHLGWWPVPFGQLPLELPDIKDIKPKGASPLATDDSFVNATCPKCGGTAKRETDTMDGFVDNSWYYYRYLDPHNSEAFCDPSILKNWMPVDLYMGGAEHTVGHLNYSRFFTKVLYDEGLVSFTEPFTKLRHQGLVLAEDSRKMSKRWGNVIAPEDVIRRFGADSLRLFEMFMGPFSDSIPWSTKGLVGCRRFIDKVWDLYQRHFEADVQSNINGTSDEKSPAETQLQSEKDFSSPMAIGGRNDSLSRHLHQTIKKITQDLEDFKFNTAIAAMMEFVNEWSKAQSNVSRHFEADVQIKNTNSTSDEKSPNATAATEISPPGLPLQGRNDTLYHTFLLLLAPFAPHMAEELWQRLQKSEASGQMSDVFNSIHLQPWPAYDPELIKEDTVEIPVQVNGKLRATLKLETENSKLETAVKDAALANGQIKKWIGDKPVRKTIFIPGRLINLVI